MGNLAVQIDFGRPNAKIGQKMANGWLLFLALSLNWKSLNYFAHSCLDNEGSTIPFVAPYNSASMC